MNSSSIAIIALTLASVGLSFAAPGRHDVFFTSLAVAFLISYLYAQLELKWFREDQERFDRIKKEIAEIREHLKTTSLRNKV